MDSVFFWLSKSLWMLLSPDSLFVLLIVSTWILLVCGAARWAKWILGSVSAVLIVLSVLPIGEWILSPLENRFQTNPKMPSEVHGIIVLGGPEDSVRSLLWGQVEVNEAAERFIAALALSKRFPNSKLVFTSGSASIFDQTLKGSDVAKRLFAEQGIDSARIVLESESRNTAENVSFSKKIVLPGSGESWVVVTSAFHMPRAMGIFCRAEWPVIPYPVDHRTLKNNLLRFEFGLIGNVSSLSLGTKEWLGLAAYFATGKTSSFFPAGCS